MRKVGRGKNVNMKNGCVLPVFNYAQDKKERLNEGEKREQKSDEVQQNLTWAACCCEMLEADNQ